MRTSILAYAFLLAHLPATGPARDYTSEQLAAWLKRFPAADADEDGTLTSEEAEAFRKKIQQERKGSKAPTDPSKGGAPRVFEVDPGWDEPDFPDRAVSKRTPVEIAAIYAEQVGQTKAITSFAKPADGALRIVGTGHSFMGPGYGTLPRIAKAAGFAEQPMLLHTSGGMTGSARYKWEQENGIFGFDGKPTPKLLASIANADWDVMMWGPYFNDRPRYYSCWIDFCLRYHPEMKFYLSDAWPQLHQLGDTVPENEEFFTEEVFDRIGREKHELYAAVVRELRKDYGDQVFILPTSDAMTLAAKRYLHGELPGIEGINRIIGGKERSLWRDQLGHLGPGFERLEGYVFFATLYGRSPETIEGPIEFGRTDTKERDFPSAELDTVFREIAWEAVTGHPLSGVTDENGDGWADD